jgi:type II secretory ATPase GspE/PulE/Tfp pilus assembly ATPase PilB-like protein
MSIDEKRVPQDGRIQMQFQDKELDLRVSIIPTSHGESVVMRILDKPSLRLGLSDLGFFSDDQETFEKLITLPDGIILVTGPTGSGKTTTLYACLNYINRPDRKIITVEDPVEYHLDGVTQVPVNVKAGMTFAGALRSILRQDPDVLMVGEMRDGETAAIAVQAALTGHLVFSTLHTNDAACALTRLADLKVEPYLVAATLEGVLAQRLVRKICPECRERYKPDPDAVALLARQPVGRLVLERGRGCPACRQTGYRGRTGIFELLAVTEEIKRQLLKAPDAAALRELGEAQGMMTLRRDGWRKVQAGVTTVEEVLRVTDQ